MEIVLNQIGNGSSLDTYIGREEGQNHKELKSWGLKASSSETFQQVWQDCSALQSINWCLKSWRIATFAGSFEWKGSRSAVTGLANFDFTPLLWCPQGPKGCLEKRNYPLSLNLVVWCTKIQPKTKQVLSSNMTRKMTKNYDFLTVFWSFRV